MIRKVAHKQWKIIASGLLLAVFFILFVLLTNLLGTQVKVSAIVYLFIAVFLLGLLSVLLFLQSADEITFQNATERYGMAYESLDVKWIINSDGSALVNREIKVAATNRLHDLDTFLFYVSEQTDEWKIDRNNMKVQSLTQGWNIYANAEDFKLTGGRLSALLHIYPPLNPGQSMTYKMTHEVPKGFYTVFRESTGSDPSKDYDYSGWTISRPTRRLHLRVYLPTVKPDDYQLHVLYASTSDLPVQRAHYEEGARSPKVELQETDQERYLLDLSIDYPVTGLVYVLRWLPPVRFNPPSTTPAAPVSEAFSGIDPVLRARIHSQLTKCGPFENDQSLRNIFIDNRISSWRTGIPQANNVRERVDALMAYLISRKDASGQNGLVIFLYVLSQESHDHCKDALMRLAAELEQSLNTNS